MGKIRLNLVSGAIIEKPLINAFKANNSSYVVLDNEMNGSMGLPIILVCKLDNNKLIKIVDQNEWQIVKEYLKNIIAGNQIEFIGISSELQADDIYYTQLTLPVPSFDALKNAYNVESNSMNVSSPSNSNINGVNNVNPNPVDNTASIMDINFNSNGVPSIDNNMQGANMAINNPNTVPVSSENGVAEAIPSEPVNPNPMANMNSGVVNNVSGGTTNIPNPGDIVPPTMNIPVSPASPEEPKASVETSNPTVANNIETGVNMNMGVDTTAPAVDLGISMPNMGIAEGSQGPVGVNPVIEAPQPQPNPSEVVAPVIPEVAPVNTDLNAPMGNEIFKEQKEAFMQACENMFDALVQKFEKELENKR